MDPSRITECPFCRTDFRVTDEQLNVADGAVRCGACLEVFVATENFVGDAEDADEREDPPGEKNLEGSGGLLSLQSLARLSGSELSTSAGDGEADESSPSAPPVGAADEIDDPDFESRETLKLYVDTKGELIESLDQRDGPEQHRSVDDGGRQGADDPRAPGSDDEDGRGPDVALGEQTSNEPPRGLEDGVGEEAGVKGQVTGQDQSPYQPGEEPAVSDDMPPGRQYEDRAEDGPFVSDETAAHSRHAEEPEEARYRFADEPGGEPPASNPEATRYRYADERASTAKGPAPRYRFADEPEEEPSSSELPAPRYQFDEEPANEPAGSDQVATGSPSAEPADESREDRSTSDQPGASDEFAEPDPAGQPAPDEGDAGARDADRLARDEGAMGDAMAVGDVGGSSMAGAVSGPGEPLGGGEDEEDRLTDTVRLVSSPVENARTWADELEPAGLAEPEVPTITERSMDHIHRSVGFDPEVEIRHLPEGRSIGRWLGWLSANGILLAVLAAQHMWYERDAYVQHEGLRDRYEQFCSFMNCDLPDYADRAKVRTQRLVVRLHPDVEKALIVEAIIANVGRYRQPFPELELRFSDIEARSIASRRFSPEEYLGGELAGHRYFPPLTEVRLSLEILDPGQEAVNYSLTVVDG